MFNYVPLPPKDYALKAVPMCQRDSPQFTPTSEPRVTQTTLGLFCSPIEYEEGETPEKIEIPPVNQYVLDTLTKDARASWVDKPGEDDFFLHDIYKKYSVKFDSYNPTNRHMEKVFNRSYKYELVCLEDSRLQKLRDKCAKEESMWENEFKLVGKKEHEERHPPLKVLGCNTQPPFWWKKTNEEDGGVSGDRQQEDVNELSNLGQIFSTRWAEEPCLTAATVNDPCRRKYDMQL